MRSEEAGAVAREPELDIVTALDERTRGAAPGDLLDIESLSDRDPYGAEAFAEIARRFGAQRKSTGEWILERTPRWRPGWLDRAQPEAFFELFEIAFGYAMDPRLWAWKYRDAPRPGMGAWKDGRMIAYYGAIPRPVLMFGKPQSCVQIGDVMVHPSERGVMTRSGALLVAAASYIERSVGHGRPHLFGFGFPTETALVLPKKLGLYEQVDRMSELIWLPQAGWKNWLSRTEVLTRRDDATVDRLWVTMAQDFADSIIGIRDAAYLAQRYRDHPTVAYELLLVRRRLTGSPWGVVVLRMADSELAELVDLVGPQRSFPALILAARHWASQRSAKRLRAWVTASHERHLAHDTHSITPMELAVPANVWTPGPTPDELRDRWWLMAGDTDFR